MKMLLLLIFSVLLFPSGCATRTVRPEPQPVETVDWTKVKEHVAQLTRAIRVKGPHQNRGDVETGDELWDLSLQQEYALDRANGKLGDVNTYIVELADKAHEVEVRPACKSWQVLCRMRTPGPQ